MSRSIDPHSPGATLGAGAEARAGDGGLDHGLIDQLRGLADGDPGFLSDLYTMFRDDGGRRLDGLDDALTRGDWTALTRGAHGLKGVAATIGARHLSELCRGLELDLKAHAAGAPRVRERVDDIRAELGRACAALAPLLCA